MWDHIPIHVLIGQAAGVGAGKQCAVQSWIRTLDAIMALPEVER